MSSGASGRSARGRRPYGGGRAAGTQQLLGHGLTLLAGQSGAFSAPRSRLRTGSGTGSQRRSPCARPIEQVDDLDAARRATSRKHGSSTQLRATSPVWTPARARTASHRRASSAATDRPTGQVLRRARGGAGRRAAAGRSSGCRRRSPAQPPRAGGGKARHSATLRPGLLRLVEKSPLELGGQLFERGLRLFGDLPECIGIDHGDLGENLAVMLDPRSTARDELVVRQPACRARLR